MGNTYHGAYMKRLFECIACDVAEKYQITMSLEWRRELGAIFSDRAIQFLTVELPSCCKTLEKSILFPGELEVAPSWGFLKFLYERFNLTGDPAMLRDIRQLSYLFYKYELPYDKDLENKVLDSFIEVDLKLPKEFDSKDPVLRKARAFIARVLGNLDYRDIFPKHGPGAVATGERVQQKSVFKRIYRQIETVYPHCEYYRFNLSHVADRVQEIQEMTVLEDGAAKVVLVPKDSRGPRLISCEPLEYQWIQQGISQKLTDRLEAHPLTKGHVNFTDQTVNRELALQGSRDNSWATLDMKEASDRVSVALVKECFAGTGLLEALLATRTPRTLLPNGRLVQMNKFAPMGSALCFPVESFVFYALAIASLEIYGKLSPKKAREAVYVYGDDIIVRKGLESFLFEVFPRFGLMFNLGKCCYTDTHFRESCGMDAYKGVDVTPVKLRSVWSSSSPTALASFVSYHNELSYRGYPKVAAMIKGFIEAHYPKLPVTSQYAPTSSRWLERLDIEHPYALMWYTPGVNAVTQNKYAFDRRYNTAYQRYELLSHTIRPKRVKTCNDGWEELLRKVMTCDVRSRVGVYSLPRRVELKRGWVAEPL